MHREVISAFVAPIKYVWEQEFGSDIETTDTESAIEMEKTGAMASHSSRRSTEA